MPQTSEEFIPTRRSLLTRLKDWDDKEGWRQFFETYWKLVYSTALKAGLKEADAEDVVQDTIVSVAKQMQQFRYDPKIGSFKSWLLLITRRRIHDHFRKVYRRAEMSFAEPEGNQTRVEDRIPQPEAQSIEAIWEAEWQKNLAERALARVKAKTPLKQYQIFDCYVAKGWPVEKVASAFKVTTGQVYLAKHRISALLKKETERIENNLDD